MAQCDLLIGPVDTDPADVLDEDVVEGHPHVVPRGGGRRGPMRRVCRGNFCRIRRLIAATERSTLEQTALSKATTARATSHQKETALQEEDRRV
jgi:hypothetical protein